MTCVLLHYQVAQKEYKAEGFKPEMKPKMSPVMRKPVFGVFDQVGLKPAYLEAWNFGYRN